MDHRLKLGIAAGAALAAVVTAGWMGARSMGVGRTVRSAEHAAGGGVDRSASNGAPAGERREMSAAGPRRVESPHQAEFNEAYQKNLDYPDPEDAARMFEDGVADLAIRAEQDDALGNLGIAARRGLIEAWRLFMMPLLTADAEGFERAIIELGGVAGSSAIHDRLADYFKDARVDLSSARIIDIDTSQPGAVPASFPAISMSGMPRGVAATPMMVEVNEIRDGATGETTRIRQLNIPLGAIFPEAADRVAGGAKTVAVWAPAKLAGAKGRRADFGPTTYFVHDPRTGRWQPVGMRVALVSDDAASKLNETMRSRRQAVETERGEP